VWRKIAVILTLCILAQGQTSRIDLAANVKGILPSANGGSPISEVEVTADWANSTTTASNITGMSWSIAASTINTFDCWWVVDTAGTTTGLQIGFTGPASPTSVNVLVEMATSTTVDAARTFKTLAAFSSFTTATTSAGATKQLWRLSGVIINGTTAGTIQAQGKSNSTTAVNVRKGSVCRVH
jgi:hypothetical protein